MERRGERGFNGNECNICERRNYWEGLNGDAAGNIGTDDLLLLAIFIKIWTSSDSLSLYLNFSTISSYLWSQLPLKTLFPYSPRK